MKDFFISYNRHDKQWAEWIAWTLEEAGYTVVIQAWDFRPGGNFVLDMNKAVTETQTTIVVLSETFLRSDYTAPEWAAAFARDPRSAARKLIPVRVGECQPEGLLAQIVYVDLVGVAENLATDLVLSALQARAKPANKPGFPGAVTPKVERTEPQPVAFPGTEATVEPTAGSGLKLRPFDFTVVTVNSEGKPIKSEKRTASSFQESLGYGVGLEMVSLPSGAFVMGAPETEAESNDEERPQHLVRVSPFFMGKYLVTQEQWFMVSSLSQINCTLDSNCAWFKGLKRPVERVSWFEVVEFCDRLSRKTGRAYRLPSEAEWEYSCRTGTTTPFHFGETITTDLANYHGTDWEFGSGAYGQGPKGISREQTTDVGSFPPNAFGLYDMHGNIEEWCLDYWHNNYQEALGDGSAWGAGEPLGMRVKRGGDWNKGPRSCRSASRELSHPVTFTSTLGFRVVCAAP